MRKNVEVLRTCGMCACRGGRALTKVVRLVREEGNGKMGAACMRWAGGNWGAKWRPHGSRCETPSVKNALGRGRAVKGKTVCFVTDA